MIAPIQTFLDRDGLDIPVCATFPGVEDVGTHEHCLEPCVGVVIVTEPVYSVAGTLSFRVGQTIEPTPDEIHRLKTLCMTRAESEQPSIVHFEDVQVMPDYDQAEAA